MRIHIFMLGLLLLPTLLPAQEEENADDNAGRMRYRYLMRRDEKGEIPVNALMKAKHELDLKRAFVKGTLQRKPMDAGLTGWEWLGPGNIGGRILSILISPTAPNVIWIGSPSGGIWRTDDAGASWYAVNDFMANLSVTSLVLDPTNPQIMYAGTGETGFGSGKALGPLGAGIFKSTDAGLTWSQLSSTANSTFTGVTRLAHHPILSGTLLAATDAGLFRTTDGGITWHGIAGMNVLATQVKYHPVNPNEVLCGTQSGFFLSSDGGSTWASQTSGGSKLPTTTGRCEGDFAQSDNSIYVNMDRNNGEIWGSTDGGTTWTLRNTGLSYFGGNSQGWYDNAIWVDPTNSSFLIIGGRNLQRSTDGGLNFKKIGGDTSGVIISTVHPDIHAIVPHPQYNGSTNKTVFIGCDGGFYETSDITTASLQGGWQYLNNFLGITQFYGGATASDGSVVMGVAQDNDRVHYTASGGVEAWYGRTGGSAGGGDGTSAAIDFTNPNRIYAATTGLNIGRSDDGGHSYNVKTNGISDAGLWVSPLVIDPNNASSLITGGQKIWRTTDQAENWTQIRNAIVSTPSCTAIDIGKGNSNLIWLGYDNGQLSKTTDGGTTWTNLPGGSGSPATAITSIAINPSDNSVVMVTYGGYITNNVWLTEDSGTTWSQRTGASPNNLPAIQVNTVRFHPVASTWVYLGTDLGVFASEDRGLTWNALPGYNQNEGPANVEVSQLFWQGSQYLYAATFGRGMFRAQPSTGIFVNLNNPNAGDGSFGNPFKQVQDGINAQLNGAPMYIMTGTYQQAPVTFNKRGFVRTWNGLVIIK